MCEHLQILEDELKKKKIKETFRGKAWGMNCKEWVYYDCYFDLELLRPRINFPESIKDHRNDDLKPGTEEGLVCDLCKDAIMGLNRKFRANDGKTIYK